MKWGLKSGRMGVGGVLGGSLCRFIAEIVEKVKVNF